MRNSVDFGIRKGVNFHPQHPEHRFHSTTSLFNPPPKSLMTGHGVELISISWTDFQPSKPLSAPKIATMEVNFEYGNDKEAISKRRSHRVFRLDGVGARADAPGIKAMEISVCLRARPNRMGVTDFRP